MASVQYCDVRIINGELDLPTHDNDNWRLFPEWSNCEEFFIWIRRRKTKLIKQRAADPRLWSCPEHRQTWEITLAMEKCGLWHYRGVR